MNEEIQSRITKYMDAIESSAQKTGEFLSEQTPLLAQEYLAWYFWSHCFFVVVVSIVFVLSLFVIRWLRKEYKIEEEKSNNSEVTGFITGCILVALVFSLGSLVFICVNIYEMIKVTVAPRVVLLEKVTELLDKVN